MRRHAASTIRAGFARYHMMRATRRSIGRVTSSGTMTLSLLPFLSGGPRSPALSSFPGHGEFPALPTRDVVFAFPFETWSEAENSEMFRPSGRLLGTLLHHPSVDKLLVANPYQSWPSRMVRRLTGRLDERPFDVRRPGTTLVSPYRIRRRNPAAVGAARRTYMAYDRALRHAAERLGMNSPAVITSHPLLAGFSPLEWAHSVTYYALDDYAAHPAYRLYDPSY